MSKVKSICHFFYWSIYCWKIKHIRVIIDCWPDLVFPNFILPISWCCWFCAWLMLKDLQLTHGPIVVQCSALKMVSQDSNATSLWQPWDWGDYLQWETKYLLPKASWVVKSNWGGAMRWKTAMGLCAELELSLSLSLSLSPSLSQSPPLCLSAHLSVYPCLSLSPCVTLFRFITSLSLPPSGPWLAEITPACLKRDEDRGR